MHGLTRRFGLRLLPALLAAIALSTGCTADEDEPGIDPIDNNEGIFETFDDDADGAVDAAEFRSEVDSLGLFDDFDADSDGFLDEPEFEGGIFDQFDDDADGFLSETEYDGGVEYFAGADGANAFPAYTDLDADDDALLDGEEFGEADDTLFGFDSDGDDLLDDDEFGDGLFGAFDDDDDDLLDDDDFGFFE